MAPLRETENKLMQNFGVTNKERYGMLWYFLEWSIVQMIRKPNSIIISLNLSLCEKSLRREPNTLFLFFFGFVFFVFIFPLFCHFVSVCL